MPRQSFVHLHCHSHYSLLDGASRIPELVAHAKELGMNALALTDHGNLYGAVEFYQECRSAGINPVLGYEAYVAPGKRTDRDARRRGDASNHLTLLARNIVGFRNLIKMASVAFLEGFYYVPRIDKDILAAHKDGIVCLSGCASGEFSELILKDQIEEATRLAEWYAQMFGENFYVEIQNNGLDIQRRCAEAAIDIATRVGLPLVATSDAHYLCQADNAAHDVLLCINTGKTRGDENRLRYGSDQFYVRSAEEMYALFPNQADAVQRSQEIADSCDVELDLKTRHFPVFTPPNRKKPETYLRELCVQGLEQRYGKSAPQAAADRLQRELDIIIRMGFASYFLIVWDFVRFAREQGIPASARGSACGALVSYVLGLSDVDPLEYDLLFERFLDPNRNEAPDIDIDFCQDGRERVIAYVRQKYGEASVAQIATFGTLQARAALRDVGRVLNVPLPRVDQITKLIPPVLGITLDESLKQNADLRREYENDPQIRELIDIARKLEGTNRNAGTHAAGVVIADGPLTDFVPLQRVVRKGESVSSEQRAASIEKQATTDGQEVAPSRNLLPTTQGFTTQWVMGDLEKVGLLKMDFLGLRTLTLLDNAVRLIKKTRAVEIDLQRLPLNDAKTYALLQRGDARGVFQFESDGIRELLKRLRPDNIRDIIACTALYRPGPLQGGMVDAYVNRKHGREKPVYQHAVMEEILRETHGVMVYQEQIMRILNRLGGIELSSAYACIKAISKKKQEIIDERREEFIQGGVERGASESTVREIFELITYFGGYGFNKSHSAAYAHISYQCAYLKAHYTPEFMAALLSSEIEDGNKRDSLVEHIEDARRLDVPVHAPDINTGDVEFTVVDGKIVFGLTAIKGVGRSAVGAIVAARQEGGPFKDFFDFCERIDLKTVNRTAIERLIKAGALDGFGHRAQLTHVLPRALQSAGEAQEDRRQGQRNLFDAFASANESSATARPTGAESLPDVPEWSDSEKLRHEKEALDFYFSSHPLAQFGDDLRRFSPYSVDKLGTLAPNQEVILGGMLTQIRFQNTKKARNGNTRYVRCKVEDLTGSVECVMWPDDFARYKDEFVEDRVCFVKGAIERTREEPGLVLTRVFDVNQAKRELTRGLFLTLSMEVHGPRDIDSLAHALKRAPGPCPVYLKVRDPIGKQGVLKLGENFRVDPMKISTGELEMILGAGCVAFAGPVNGSNGY